MKLILILLSSYLIGSITFGYLIVKVKTGGNIKKMGSGNIGATNVTRILGKKWGLITFLLDAAKILLLTKICESINLEYKLILLANYLVIIGHIAPIWFNFKGGKAVASSIASVTYLMPKLGALLIITWILIFLWKRISSLSAIISFSLLYIFSFILNYSYDQKIFCISVSLTIILAHYPNILRLIEGEEKKI